MPPPAGDVAQTPESKSTGGLASVFKSLTGGRSSKNLLSPHNVASSNPASNVQIAQQLNSSSTPKGGIYSGPIGYEHLYGQLKNGRTLAERHSAAEGLRLALSDYPLSGVCPYLVGWPMRY